MDLNPWSDLSPLQWCQHTRMPGVYHVSSNVLELLGNNLKSNPITQNYDKKFNNWQPWADVDILYREQQNATNDLNRLRIPTGRRQTSWLCTSAAEELNQWLPNKSSLVVRACLEFVITRFQAQLLDLSAMLPCKTFCVGLWFFIEIEFATCHYI